MKSCMIVTVLPWPSACTNQRWPLVRGTMTFSAHCSIDSAPRRARNVWIFRPSVSRTHTQICSTSPVTATWATPLLGAMK